MSLKTQLKREGISMLFRMFDRIVAGAIGTAIGGASAYFFIKWMEGR